MAITRTRQRAFLLGKQYQLIVQQVIFTLLPCKTQQVHIHILVFYFQNLRKFNNSL